jgi:hypothetical protein
VRQEIFHRSAPVEEDIEVWADGFEVSGPVARAVSPGAPAAATCYFEGDLCRSHAEWLRIRKHGEADVPQFGLGRPFGNDLPGRKLKVSEPLPLGKRVQMRGDNRFPLIYVVFHQK